MGSSLGVSFINYCCFTYVFIYTSLLWPLGRNNRCIALRSHESSCSLFAFYLESKPSAVLRASFYDIAPVGCHWAKERLAFSRPLPAGLDVSTAWFQPVARCCFAGSNDSRSWHLTLARSRICRSGAVYYLRSLSPMGKIREICRYLCVSGCFKATCPV